MLKIIEGNLLQSQAQYIAHQCNCDKPKAKGIAEIIFRQFPYADVYALRTKPEQDFAQFGHITIHGNPEKGERRIINIYGQLFAGKPKKNGQDTYESRVVAFANALHEIAQISDLEYIAFPYGIGCGMAGGDWSKYEQMLRDFAQQVAKKKADVFLFKLPTRR